MATDIMDTQVKGDAGLTMIDPKRKWICQEDGFFGPSPESSAKTDFMISKNDIAVGSVHQTRRDQ